VPAWLNQSLTAFPADHDTKKMALAAIEAASSLLRNAIKLASVTEAHNLRWKRLLSASESKRKQLEDALVGYKPPASFFCQNSPRIA
jgi:hypothetical protein